MQIAELFATLGLKPKKGEWEAGTKLIEGMKHALELFLGYEAIKSIGELVKSTAEGAIGAERMAQKVGVTTEAVQELGYAAGVSGASNEELQVSLQHLARGMEELRTKGTGPAKDGFQALGVSMEEVRGKTPDEVLEVLADHFAKLPDGAKKTAAAMDLFGRSGTSLIPLLNKGGDGIADLRKEAEELGVVIDDKTAKSFEGLEESTLKVKGTLTGLKNSVVVALLPTIQEMAESLLEWVKANREVIASGIKTAVEGLIVVMKGFATAIGVVVDVVEYLREHNELLIGILAVLGATLLEIAADAVIAWAAALGPVTILVAAITALGLVIYDVWKSITTGKGVAATAFRWISDKVHAMWSAIKGVGNGIVDAFYAVGRGIKQAFQEAFDFVVDKAKALGHTLRNLPGIKQLGDLGEFVGGGIADLTGASNPYSDINAVVEEGSPEAAAAAAAYASPPAYRMAPASMRRDVNVNVGAPQISVTSNSADPKAVADQVGKHVDAWFDGVLQDAHAATGGADEP